MNDFFSLRAHCAFGARALLGGCVHSLPLGKERTKKARQGLAPAPRAAEPRTVRAFGGKLRFPRRRSKVKLGENFAFVC